jgi:membrane protease YdiL (CAAX protease family)
MVVESIAYAIIFAFIISNFVAFLFFSAPVEHLVALRVSALQSQGFWTQIALSLGAGFYEELVFRVLLVSGLFWIFVQFIGRKDQAYVTAVIIAALIFSAVHYIGPLGDSFNLASFTFRFLFGLALNALYVLRGFGIAAWTHALYDVMVVIYLMN